MDEDDGRIATRPMRAVRPADLTGVYVNPRDVLRKRAQQGRLHRVAYGVYVAPPDDLADPRRWRPDLEDAAGAVAVVEFGPDQAIAAGTTAARLHGVIPRARAEATIAVPRRHRPVTLVDRPDGTVRFVVRDTDQLDAQRLRTRLGPMLVTTVEQTLVDLVTGRDRDDPDVVEAVDRLADRADWRVVDDITRQQQVGRRGTARLRALRRVEER